MKPIELLPPHLRSEPGAAGFAEALADACPEALDQFEGCGQYGWEEPVPPREEWETAALRFAGSVYDCMRDAKEEE